MRQQRKKKQRPAVKVIFLDVDGVLNNGKHWFQCRLSDERIDNSRICPLAVERLRRLVAQTGARVVLSSAWRLSAEHREAVRRVLAEIGIRFYGITPDFSFRPRGHEIGQWLREHPEVTSYVILDDNDDMDTVQDRLVQTDFNTGLLDEHVERATALLAAA